MNEFNSRRTDTTKAEIRSQNNQNEAQKHKKMENTG